MCAGSWLIASVVIERTRQMSSATLPRCGNSSESSIWHWPCFAKPNIGPLHTNFCPCSCASCCPFVNDSGIGLPSIAASFGL